VKRWWTASLLLGLVATGLSGCYVVSPYAYPPPPYPAPAYVAPPPRGSSPAPPPAPSGQSPAPPGGPTGAVKGCQTVTVEGHYETRTRQGGQPETLWVPTHQEQICQ